jgi:hypothetical protein
MIYFTRFNFYCEEVKQLVYICNFWTCKFLLLLLIFFCSTLIRCELLGIRINVSSDSRSLAAELILSNILRWGKIAQYSPLYM